MTRRAALLALLALLAVPGCSRVLVREPPAKQRFVLAPELPAAPGGAGRGVLRVARVRVSSRFERTGFVYRVGESRYESDFYNEFFTPPGEMLRELLGAWARASGRFATVGSRGLVEVDWVLEPYVEALYVDRRDPSAPASVFAVRLRLLDLRGTHAEVALEQGYAAREPAAEGTPRALVDAWQRAVARALADALPDLDAALAGRPAGGGATR